jgi:tryptophan synthase alpha chain
VTNGRIVDAFARSGKRAALMPYLMGGFPDLDTSRRIGEAYVDAGADLIELGMPFSDPLADGPAIHAAGTASLRAGTTVDGVLEVGRALAQRVPVALMCYANPILARGVEAFAAALADGGIDGLIVPDLPSEEAGAVRRACDAAGVALIPLVAPTTPDDRLKHIGAQARGFVYTVSVAGTTGERNKVSNDLKTLLGRTKDATEVPVAVGFGIATPEQAAKVADEGAEGVIIGSRLVREAAEAADPPSAVHKLVTEMAQALTPEARRPTPDARRL